MLVIESIIPRWLLERFRVGRSILVGPREQLTDDIGVDAVEESAWGRSDIVSDVGGCVDGREQVPNALEEGDV